MFVSVDNPDTVLKILRHFSSSMAAPIADIIVVYIDGDVEKRTPIGPVTYASTAGIHGR